MNKTKDEEYSTVFSYIALFKNCNIVYDDEILL